MDYFKENFGELDLAAVNKKRADIILQLKALEQDDGRRIAFVYKGDNAVLQAQAAEHERYAMVRAVPDADRQLTIIHTYSDPANIEHTCDMLKAGFEAVGFVDNCYADTLGLVNDPRQPNDVATFVRKIDGVSYLPKSELTKAQ